MPSPELKIKTPEKERPAMSTTRRRLLKTASAAAGAAVAFPTGFPTIWA